MINRTDYWRKILVKKVIIAEKPSVAKNIADAYNIKIRNYLIDELPAYSVYDNDMHETKQLLTDKTDIFGNTVDKAHRSTPPNTFPGFSSWLL